MEPEKEKTTQNGTVTQEDFDQLKAQLEVEKADRDRLIAEATQPLQGRITELEATLASTPTTLEFEAMKGELTKTVTDYRQLLIQSNPLYTEELVTGATIEELKASTGKANALIAKVREGLEKSSHAEAAATVIPAGAPGRQGPDFSSMTSVEKINYGLEQARKKK